jgi:hypothetical protein
VETASEDKPYCEQTWNGESGRVFWKELRRILARYDTRTTGPYTCLAFYCTLCDHRACRPIFVSSLGLSILSFVRRLALDREEQIAKIPLLR